MAKKRSNHISTLGSKITTVISVSLVLLIVGLILTIACLTTGAGDSLRQKVAMVVRLDDNTTDDQIKHLSDLLVAAPYTATLDFNSADDVLRQESQENGDILELLDTNPFTAEFEVYLKPDYVNSDSVAQISADLVKQPSVAEVYSQVDVIDNVNHFLKQATLVLSLIGAVLLIISVVLIFNTISLVIYSRRFVIHTMQLVGATRKFIRSPFVRTGMLLGMISAIISSLALIAINAYAQQIQIDSLFFVGWVPVACICGVMVLTGMLFCGASSFFATNRFLNSTYDELYSK